MNEAKNSEKCFNNFQKRSPHIADYIYVPKVHWNLTTTKLLTTEFVDGAPVNDVNSVRRLGVRPNDVAKLVSSLTYCYLDGVHLDEEIHITMLKGCKIVIQQCCLHGIQNKYVVGFWNYCVSLINSWINYN